jgi:hypothetical protein
MFIGQGKDLPNKPQVNYAIRKCASAASANINILQNLKKMGLFSDFGFWDARYLFSSLLILYMISGGGANSDLIAIGRQLNREMASSGNFTAIENEKRFKELDFLFDRMRDRSDTDGGLLSGRSTEPISAKAKEAVVSPNSLLVDDIAKIFTNISALDSENNIEDINDLFEPLPKELLPDIWKDITTNLMSWDEGF